DRRRGMGEAERRDAAGRRQARILSAAASIGARMKRFFVAVFALVLSACAFSSEEPLFAARDAATPIRDGAQFAWIEGGESSEQRSLLFRRDGRAYVVEAVGRSADRPMRALFVPIRETREDDYIVQTQFDDDAVAYAYLWRRGDGYRMIVNLG